MEKRPQPSSEWARYTTLAQVGLEMVVPIVVGVWLDYRLETQPWLTLAGIVLGFVAGMWHLISVASRESKMSKDGAGPPAASK